MKNFKEISGESTPWRGQYVSWYKRLLWKLYQKYVNKPFIPKNAKIRISNYSTLHKDKKQNDIDSVQINDDCYIFSQFNEITFLNHHDIHNNK